MEKSVIEQNVNYFSILAASDPELMDHLKKEVKLFYESLIKENGELRYQLSLCSAKTLEDMVNAAIHEYTITAVLRFIMDACYSGFFFLFLGLLLKRFFFLKFFQKILYRGHTMNTDYRSLWYYTIVYYSMNID